MTAKKKLMVLLADLGKGLVLNPITKLVDVLLSTDSGNGLQFGSDNGLYYSGDGTVHLTVALSLGSKPVYSKHLTLASASAKTTSVITINPRPISDELEMDGLVCSAGCTVNGIIDIYIVATPGPVIGPRTFNLTIK